MPIHSVLVAIKMFDKIVVLSVLVFVQPLAAAAMVVDAYVIGIAKPGEAGSDDDRW